MKSFTESRSSISWPLSLAILAAVLFIAITLVTYTKIPSTLTQLAFLPILWAALLLEWRGGLSMALFISLVMTLDIQEGYFRLHPDWLITSSLYFLFGIICSALFDLRKRHLQKAKHHVLHLTDMYSKMLSGLAGTLEIRDRHTQGHSERVAKNALVLGRAIGLQKKQLDILYWSGLLHDLGKIAIPEAILLKPSPLSDSEYAEIKRHPVYGADLLSSVSPEFREISLAVRHHHERWDGLGYPKGLQKSNIPLLSRVISVVDVFEALTSQRPYRQPLSPSEALMHLKQGSGSHFDPELIQAFETCFERGAIRYLPESAFGLSESSRAFIKVITPSQSKTKPYTK